MHSSRVTRMIERRIFHFRVGFKKQLNVIIRLRNGRSADMIIV